MVYLECFREICDQITIQITNRVNFNIQGVRLRLIFFSCGKKSSIFVRFSQNLAHLSPKAWGFVILYKKFENFFPGNKRSAKFGRALFQLTRLSSTALAPNLFANSRMMKTCCEISKIIELSRWGSGHDYV